MRSSNQADTLQYADMDCYVGAGEDSRSVSIFVAASQHTWYCTWQLIPVKQVVSGRTKNLLMLSDLTLRYDNYEGYRSYPAHLGPVHHENSILTAHGALLLLSGDLSGIPALLVTA